MKFLWLFFIAFLSFASLAKATDTAQAELFSRSAQYSNMKLSPDGTYLSAITSIEGKNALIILDTNSKQLINVLNFPSNAQTGDYAWVSDERLVLQKEYVKGWSDSPLYYGELMAVNADGSRAKYLFGYNGGQQQASSRRKTSPPIRATAFILDPLIDDPKHVLVNAIPWNSANTLNYASRQNVYLVDVYRGTRDKITRAPIGYARFMTDDKGIVRFVAGEDDNNKTQVFYRPDRDWLNSQSLDLGLTDFSPISFTDKPNSIYATGRKPGETLGVYKIDLATGAKEKILQDPKLDPVHYWLNQQTKQLYSVEYQDDYPTYTFVNQEDKQSQQLKQLIASFPGQQVYIVSQTRDGKKQIILTLSDQNPGDYYLFDTEKVQLRHLVPRKNWINPKLMAKVKPITLTNRDNIEISGYLTLPQGHEAKNLPLIVNPHGGPHGVRDEWGFDAQNQLLASQGYAVLQVNFRGSGGFGETFEQAGHQKWGSDIQFDIIDATRHLIDQGIANKERVCILGSSFGGYSALQSAILEPDMFKCAIGFAGIYDLPLMFKKGDIAARVAGKSYLKQVLGQDESILKAMSPSYNTDKLKAKLLLVHGGDDERAPIEQLESLEDALKARQYPYEKLVMDDEGHGFYNDDHRAKYYQKMLDFLDASLAL
jgi:dipeptidyl aminopeptidase/acylaminoacyl peptidase